MTKDLSNHYFGKSENEIRQNDTRCLGSLIGGVIAFILCAFATALLPSCTHTQYVTQEVPVVVHDTLTTTLVKYDSVHHRDSVFLHTYIKGDTVHENHYSEHWNTEYHTLYDTLYVLQYVPTEYVVHDTVEVPAELTKQQKLLMKLGKWMIFTLCLFLLYIFSYLVGKSLDKKKANPSS